MIGLLAAQRSLLFLVYTLPLLFFPWIYLAFELPKVMILYIGTAILLGIFCSKQFYLYRMNIAHFLAILLFLWLVLSSVIGIDLGHSFWGNYFRREGLITWFCYLVIFIASGVAVKNEFIRKDIALLIGISALVVSVIGILQFISLWAFGHTDQLLYNGRIISTFGQPNFLGAFLVLSLPFFGYLTKNTNHILKFPWILSVGIVGLAIILTFSRSAWVALLILLILWGIRCWKLLVVAVSILVITLTILANLFPLLLHYQIQRVQFDLGGKWTAENRTLIAERSVNLIVKRPITGWGMENLVLVFPIVTQESDIGLKDIVVDSAHNIFLDIAVESGLIGLAIFVAFLSGVLWLGKEKLREHDGEYGDFLTTCLLTVIVFVIAHQFSVMSVVPLVLFWFAAGVIAGPLLHYHRDQAVSRWYKGFSVLIIFIVVVFVVQNIRADVHYRDSTGYEVIDTRKAIEMQQEAIDLAPWVQFYQWRQSYLKSQLGM